MKFNDLKYYAIVRNKETDKFSHQKLRGNPTLLIGGMTHRYTGNLKADLSRPAQGEGGKKDEYDHNLFDIFADELSLPEKGLIYRAERIKLILFDFEHFNAGAIMSEKMFNILGSFYFQDIKQCL